MLCYEDRPGPCSFKLERRSHDQVGPGSLNSTTREEARESLRKKLRPSHMRVVFRVLTNVIKNIQTLLLNQWENWALIHASGQ